MQIVRPQSSGPFRCQDNMFNCAVFFEVSQFEAYTGIDIIYIFIYICCWDCGKQQSKECPGIELHVSPIFAVATSPTTEQDKAVRHWFFLIWGAWCIYTPPALSNLGISTTFNNYPLLAFKGLHYIEKTYLTFPLSLHFQFSWLFAFFQPSDVNTVC